MAWWQYGLIALGIAWAIQAWGVWRQTRHYQSVFSEVRRKWSDGALGAGAAPAKFGKGAIAIVVADPQGVVRAVRVMQGRSVFAKFEARPQYEGLTTAALAKTIAVPGFDGPLGKALGQALGQIEKVARRETAAPALAPA
jgi:glucitol operon activator protein